MALIRAYQKTCSSQMNSWRIHKRLAVTKYSLQYLANIYRADQYLPPVDFALTEEGKLINEFVSRKKGKTGRRWIVILTNVLLLLELNSLTLIETTITNCSVLRSYSYTQFMKSWYIL